MNKLGMLSLAAFKQEFPVLSESELRNTVGGSDVYFGGDSTFEIGSGYFVNWNWDGDKFCVYYPKDGSEPVILDGVNVTGEGFFGLQPGNSAYQLGGYIHVGDDWRETMTFDTISHEYGHYLQQEASQMAYIPLSLMSVLSSWVNDPYTHSQKWYEENATNLGLLYMMEHYPDTYYNYYSY